MPTFSSVDDKIGLLKDFYKNLVVDSQNHVSKLPNLQPASLAIIRHAKTTRVSPTPADIPTAINEVVSLIFPFTTTLNDQKNFKQHFERSSHFCKWPDFLYKKFCEISNDYSESVINNSAWPKIDDCVNKI